MSDQSIVPVTQVDREAAAAFMTFHWPVGRALNISMFGQAMTDGEADEHELVQAFARHRIAEREACAKVAEEAVRMNLFAVQSAIDAGDETAELKYQYTADESANIAAAIRARSDRVE